MNPDFLTSHIATGKPEFYLHCKVVDWAKGHYNIIKGPIKLSKYSWSYSSVNRHWDLEASFNEKFRDLFLFYLISDKTKKLKWMKEQHSELFLRRKWIIPQWMKSVSERLIWKGFCHLEIKTMTFSWKGNLYYNLILDLGWVE